MLVNLKDKITPYMAAKKVSQDELARKVGYTRAGLLKKLEKNDLELSLWVTICDFLNAPPSIAFEAPVNTGIIKEPQASYNERPSNIYEILFGITHKIEKIEKRLDEIENNQKG